MEFGYDGVESTDELRQPYFGGSFRRIDHRNLITKPQESAYIPCDDISFGVAIVKRWGRPETTPSITGLELDATASVDSPGGWSSQHFSRYLARTSARLASAGL